MDLFIEGLKNKKSGEKYHDSVIDDAIYYIEKAQSCLDEGLKNPEQWHKDNLIINKSILQLLPQMCVLQQFHSSQMEVEES